MTTTRAPAPAPSPAEDYAARMRRVVADATDAGLDGLLVTPGPDLFWLTGYRPTAITERLTVLVLAPDREPTLLVPTLERPDAEGAVGAPSLAIVDWADGEDPFARAGAVLVRTATMGIADSAWAMHLLGLQDALPGCYLPLADPEPAHAAGGQGRHRAGPAGSRGRRRGRDVRADPGRPLRRPEGDRRRGRPGPAAARARARAGRLHGRRLGPQRRQPPPRGRATAPSRSATRSCSTSAG